MARKIGKRKEMEDGWQFQKMALQTEEEVEPEEGLVRKLSQDSGVGDSGNDSGGEFQELAELFGERRIADYVTAMEARIPSSCSSMMSTGDDARTLELDIFTMCR